MQQHECTYMCLGLIVNFNSIKINFLLFLSAHKQIIKPNCPIWKNEIFRVLQLYIFFLPFFV